jgi:4-hydroxy-3-methylbut-2-en-1-yl diphosphate reductase
MKITLDPSSGFCAGVVHAVKVAEHELRKEKPLFCLGELVHNEREVARLRDLGLITISREEFRRLRDRKVMIRAHGEPPETYRIAYENNITLVDASCSIVMQLQKDIMDGSREMQQENGQVVIYGKQGHAEVEGLLGQAGEKAIVVGRSAEVDKIDLSRPVRLYSQTTMSPEEFMEVVGAINEGLEKRNGPENNVFLWKNTICRQVSNRSEQLKSFARRYEVVIFVSGKKSSNGLFLFGICKQVNPGTFLISTIGDLKKEWFSGVASVGICGATSTPVWLMEEVFQAIRKINGISDVS